MDHGSLLARSGHRLQEESPVDRGLPRVHLRQCSALEGIADYHSELSSLRYWRLQGRQHKHHGGVTRTVKNAGEAIREGPHRAEALRRNRTGSTRSERDGVDRLIVLWSLKTKCSNTSGC